MKRTELKVAHIVEAFTGGICTYFRNVLPALSKEGFEITLICSLERQAQDSFDTLASLQDQGIRIHILPMKRKVKILNDFLAFMRLRKILAVEDFDIIHTHCSKAGALGRLAAFFAGKKTIFYTPHCFAFLRCQNRFQKHLYRWVERMLGQITRQLIAVSKSEAQIAIQNHIVSPEKCTTIYNGLIRNWSENYLSVENIKLKHGIPQKARVVVTLCRLTEYKGIRRFLEMAQLSQNKDTTFILAGEGDLRESVERFILKNNLSHKLRFLGFQAHPEELYEIADIVVLCSDAEGLPYTLLEAMFAKRPVVATAVPGNTELISHLETGILAPATSIGLSRAVDYLLSDRSLQTNLANNAYEYCCRQHLLEDQVRQLAKLYRRHAADLQTIPVIEGNPI